MIANGTHVSEYGLSLVEPPAVQIPAKRITRIPIPGRSGYLRHWDGAYEAVTKQFEMMYDGDTPDVTARWMMEWERVIFPNEPDRAYRILSMGDEISTNDLARQVATHHRFPVQLVCDPLKREISPQIITAASSPVNLYNIGNYRAQPTIIITGTGNVTLTIGTQVIALTSIGPSITIDGDLLDCYQGSTPANSKMTGDFPVIEAGEALTVSWTGTVTKVEIRPNWRWV